MAHAGFIVLAYLEDPWNLMRMALEGKKGPFSTSLEVPRDPLGWGIHFSVAQNETGKVTQNLVHVPTYQGLVPFVCHSHFTTGNMFFVPGGLSE